MPSYKGCDGWKTVLKNDRSTEESNPEPLALHALYWSVDDRSAKVQNAGSKTLHRRGEHVLTASSLNEMFSD